LLSALNSGVLLLKMLNIMEKQVVKTELAHIQSQLIEDLNAQIAPKTAAADMDEADTKDPEDFSQQSYYTDFALELKVQVAKAQEALNMLEHISVLNKNTEVTVGSLVFTEKLVFFISIGSEPFEIDGRMVVGLSPQAPLYTVMRGKKVGEKFAYGRNSYTILDIQ
jgi:hypothetical protein